jgi:hypothetical protein|tara:strand:- start:91 stop:315 length:225 start_codon:yes stop_codon:yes gene_type:complete
MKSKIIILIVTLFLIGCNKKSKPCDTCPSFTMEKIPVCDTTNLRIEKSSFLGFNLPEETLTLIEIDTIYVECFN